MKDDRARSRWRAVGPDAAVRPFAVEGAEEALDLAVPARGAGRDEDVAGAELGERVAELVAGRVALGVVAHDRLRRAAALLAHPRGGASQRGRDGDRVLGAVDLAVGQAGVVVDDADDLDLAGARRVRVRLAAVAVRPVAGPVELGQLERVDVQQRAGLGPLIAARGLRPLAATLARHAVTLEHLPDRRAMPPGQELQLHRPPVGLLARGQDRLLGLDAQRPRTRARPRRPACADTLSDARSASLAARQRCHHRCAVAGATLRAAAAALSVDPLSINITSSRRPCSPSLHLRSSMSGLLRRFCRRRPHPPSEAGRPPQPFTKSVGRSARPPERVASGGRLPRALWVRRSL